MERIKYFFLSRSHRYLPSWVVLLKDLLIVLFSIAFAYTLRYNFQLTDTLRSAMYLQMVPVGIIAMIVFLLLGIHKGIIRHTGLKDALQIVLAVTCISFSMLVYNAAGYYYFDPLITHIPYSVIIIFTLLASVLILFTRNAVRLFYYWLKAGGEVTRVLIYGAGSAGLITKNVLQVDQSRTIKVVGFVDNNPGKIGKSIEGIFVYSTGVINPEFLHRHGITEIIFSIQKIDKDRKRALIEEVLLKTQLHVKEVPPVDSWINGELSSSQISPVKLTDLLQRTEIRLDNKHIKQQIEGKRVMVTGAAGSIGSELARQLFQFKPSCLILVDQGETHMFHLENSMRKLAEEVGSTVGSGLRQMEFIMGNVGDHELMTRVFEEFRPQIIYHAAAYKHVPMMERNPFEAVRVNIFGTKNLADLAAKYHAERFVMVSTDKAVNPTNVMGATKRAAEVYIQSLNNRLHEKSSANHSASHSANHSASNNGVPVIRQLHDNLYQGKYVTEFITTRFGNVLGSNGSVIPLFEKQIAHGGPVTVTHPDITRYFMTIPEACQLVLEAGALGKGGEILMFDMGKPVKIADLAYNMIRLSGLVPGKDIHIVYSGLRPGEKIHEELLYDMEKGMKSYNGKIFIADGHPAPYEDVIDHLEVLHEIINTGIHNLIITGKSGIPYHPKGINGNGHAINIYDINESTHTSYTFTGSDDSDILAERMRLMARLKAFIPEFKSNNSIYEVLDIPAVKHTFV